MTSKKDSKLEAKGSNRAVDIRIENFDIAYGDRLVFCFPIFLTLSLVAPFLFCFNVTRIFRFGFVANFFCFSVLLQGADIVLAFGRRYGFVGRNGLGKTTVLRMISSRQLHIPAHISILHVEQEASLFLLKTFKKSDVTFAAGCR